MEPKSVFGDLLIYVPSENGPSTEFPFRPPFSQTAVTNGEDDSYSWGDLLSPHDPIPFVDETRILEIWTEDTLIFFGPECRFEYMSFLSTSLRHYPLFSLDLVNLDRGVE